LRSGGEKQEGEGTTLL